MIIERMRMRRLRLMISQSCCMLPADGVLVLVEGLKL